MFVGSGNDIAGIFLVHIKNKTHILTQLTIYNYMEKIHNYATVHIT